MGRVVIGLLVVVLSCSSAVADTFEFLSYSPPTGWSVKPPKNGELIWERPSKQGVGLIMIMPSLSTIGTPAEEFSTFWRANVEPLTKMAVPKMQERKAQDLTMVWGAGKLEMDRMVIDVQMIAFVGRGRFLGMFSMTSGADAVREVAAFNASVKIVKEGPPPTTNPMAPSPPTAPSQPAASGIAVDYVVPPGYSEKREGNFLMFIPNKVDGNTPCAYGLSPTRRSTGSLEKDAFAAFLEPLPGARVDGDINTWMKGIGPTGWQYHYIVGYAKDAQNFYRVMAMAFSGPNNTVNIAWGIGNGARCTNADYSFERFFHGLRPRGWTSDGGKAAKRDLIGAWRVVLHSAGLHTMQYQFLPNGRYLFGRGSTTVIAYTETTRTTVGDGSWTFDGSELVMTADHDKSVSKVLVRVYDERNLTTNRALQMATDGTPPTSVQYFHVEDK